MLVLSLFLSCVALSRPEPHPRPMAPRCPSTPQQGCWHTPWPGCEEGPEGRWASSEALGTGQGELPLPLRARTLGLVPGCSRMSGAHPARLFPWSAGAEDVVMAFSRSETEDRRQ